MGLFRKKTSRVPKSKRDATSRFNTDQYALTIVFRGKRYYFANRLGDKELARRYKHLGYSVRLMPAYGGGFIIYTNPKPPHKGYRPPKSNK